MADKYAHEAKRTLQAIGWGVRSDPTEKYVTGDEPGRADFMCVGLGGRGFYAEIKTGERTFAFNQWTERQREWTMTYALPPPYSTPVFLWIFLGDERPNSIVAPYRRRSFLMPVQAMLGTEKLFADIQDSIPYRAGPGYNKILQENQMDAITLWKDYECLWAGNQCWKIPAEHRWERFFTGRKIVPALQGLGLIM